MSKNNHYKEPIVTSDNQKIKQDEELVDLPFAKVRENILNRLQRNPKKTFIWMVGLLAFSIIANVLWAVLYKPEPPPKVKESPILTLDPLSTGIGKIIQTSSSLNETYKIKEEIDKILAKPTLERQDSIKLLAMFEQLADINRKLSPITNPAQK